jgi:uncharacterized membrane protein
MNEYPEVVAKIANDYLERVKSQLRLVPARERDEFLRELQSHLYESYQQTSGEDEVARILAVLRNIGEPADVVSDRLPRSMVSSGTKRNLPLYVVGGIFIALFGIPLGFGGVGVLIGLLCALAGVLVAFYATAGSVLLVGALVMLLGLIRFFVPQLFDRLVELGFIQMNGPPADFLDHFSPADQGLIMILFAGLLLVGGFGMLWVGRHLLRGLRFLFSLFFDWIRRLAQGFRRQLHPQNREVPPIRHASLANSDR